MNSYYRWYSLHSLLLISSCDYLELSCAYGFVSIAVSQYLRYIEASRGAVVQTFDCKSDIFSDGTIPIRVGSIRVGSIPIRRNEIFNIFIFFLRAKRGVEFHHLTCIALRIYQNVGNKNVLKERQCRNTNFSDSFLLLYYVRNTAWTNKNVCWYGPWHILSALEISDSRYNEKHRNRCNSF